MKQLSKDEMKKVMGGVMAPPEGSCQALVPGNEGGTVVIENLNAGTASTLPGMIHWCCDNCCNASWAYHDNC